MTPRATASEIERQAADWLAREDAAPLPADAQAELDAWLAGDERRYGAYIRLRAVSARLDRLGALKSDRPAEAAARKPAPINWRVAAGIAAAVVATASSIAWLQSLPRTYHTAVGEMRRLTLSDGSVIELNTASQVEVAYTARRRDIWLTSGEGNFVVAHNKARPFVVHSAGATVTAVGTAFAVRVVDGAKVRVTVSEGVVGVTAPGDAHRRLVPALHQTDLGGGPIVAAKVIPVSYGEVARRLAWTNGRIVLAGETLGQAAAEFNRYNDRKIIVAPAAAGVPVGGVFRTSEVETFAATAAGSLHLRLASDAAGDLVLGTIPEASAVGKSEKVFAGDRGNSGPARL